ncbi:hypothetical protein BH09BAC6_BH09BAC6_25060 [soil metagenome]|jgi:predicted alpha/beta superfamily hydrolase
MKKYSLAAILVCLCGALLAQPQTDQIKIGHVDTVYSNILKEKRPILIYSPGFDTVYFSRPQYPVLYVLDGDGYFDALVTMVGQLSQINGNTVLPEMIIVGIPNTPGHRTRDLTPTKSAIDKASGGGGNFTAFMEKELIPYIDKNYATAPYRTLIGHSLGGLMVVNTLLKHTSLFNAYIAIDPTMFYDNDVLLKQTGALLKQANFKGSTLFLGFANTMSPGMDTAHVRTDTTELNHHIRAILTLKDNLQKYRGNDLRWSYKYNPDDDHNSVPLVAEYEGLRFIFYNNRFPRNQPENQFFDKHYTADMLHDMIVKHYQLLSQQRGYAVRPPEYMINQFGYIFLQQSDFERSQMFFRVNMDYYPLSFNAYDGMGDYYLARNQKAEAMQYFKKALKLKFSAEIKAKLDKLENK